MCVCVGGEGGGGRHFENCYCHVGGTIFMWFEVFFFEGGEGKVLIHPTFLKTSVPPSDFNEMQSKVT